jgi:hypothetical protein
MIRYTGSDNTHTGQSKRQRTDAGGGSMLASFAQVLGTPSSSNPATLINGEGGSSIGQACSSSDNFHGDLQVPPPPPIV